jgi:tRNA(Ile)-lysidine synthase
MTAIPTEIRRVLDQIRRDVRQHQLWQPGQRVLLACSGGRDSMAALALLDALRPSLGHDLAVAHVDHGLQANHGQTAELVAAEAARRQLPFAVQRVALALTANLEGRARTARYRALQVSRKALMADHVATAHHADDQAETVLLRLARGAGPDAHAGVRRTRADAIVRPLLGVTRAQLAQCAAYFAVPWLADPSNDDLAMTRNHLRHKVLPALEQAIPGAAAGLARSATLAAAQDGALAAWIDRALGDRLQVDSAAQFARVADADLPQLPAAKAAFLQYICRHLAVEAPSQRAVAQWLALGSRGTAHLRGLTVVGDGIVWQFFASNVAQPAPAD